MLFTIHLLALFLLLQIIEGEIDNSTDLSKAKKAKDTNATGHDSSEHEQHLLEPPPTLHEANATKISEAEFKELTSKIIQSVSKDNRTKVNCDSKKQTCSFSVQVNETKVEHIEVGVLGMQLMTGVTEPNPEDSPGRFWQFLTYHNRKLGKIRGDEPLMNLKRLPLSDLVIGTKFILEVPRHCAKKGRSNKHICRKSLNIHYDTIDKHAKSVPHCEVLSVTIHGWNAGPMTELNDPLAQFNADYYQDPCILIVDWSKGASSGPAHIEYLQPRANLITVGRQLALLLSEMIKLGKVRAKDIHLIGHSLGAQLTHQASEWLRHLIRRRPGRITGLDPAAQLFQGQPGTHLVKGDADFVDVIHTSSIASDLTLSQVLLLRFGMSQAVGTIDFYPNGGTHPQPGCNPICLLPDINCYSCSHHKSVTYFINSLVKSRNHARGFADKVFPSKPCDRRKGPHSSMGFQAVFFKGTGRHCLRT